MTDNDLATRCKAMTKAGEQCKNTAVDGTDFCHIHIPAAMRSENGKPIDEGTAEEKLSDRELREQLIVELDDLIARVRAIDPDYSPPPYTSQQMAKLLGQRTGRLFPRFGPRILNLLRASINEDWLDVETWKGMWYMVNYTLEYQSDIIKRRLKGDYETDEWGLDWEFVEAMRPFLDFMYKFYWRVEVTGIEHIPDYGRTLLVSNHSGQLPWDGAMIMTAVLNEHPAQRLVRNLYADWFPTLPFVSAVLVKMGQALASVDNGTRLLEQDELVGVFPEGYKGVSKLFKDRYKLARFGRGGFVRMALNTAAPMVPVSVVGAEETYVSVAQSPTLARLTGFPYFPLSLRFPWFGPLGVVPLPSKWYIDFGEPILTEDYDPDTSENLVLVSRLADRVRNVVQQMINDRLKKRRAVFY
jgi:1-acyl-sn-glycerol-3-phosphate acyltransferase